LFDGRAPSRPAGKNSQCPHRPLAGFRATSHQGEDRRKNNRRTAGRKKGGNGRRGEGKGWKAGELALSLLGARQ